MSSLKRRPSRGKYEIISKILKECTNPARFTHIRHLVGQNTFGTRKYLNFLQERGLLVKKGEFWITTEKGKKYLEIFEKLQNLIAS